MSFQEAGNQNTLKSSTTDDWYGTAVTLSKDGSTMAVGVPRAAGGGTRRGQVRIYKRSGDDWNIIDTINGTQDLVQQGQAISLSADGNIIAVGAAGYDNGNKSDADMFVHSNMTPQAQAIANMAAITRQKATWQVTPLEYQSTYQPMVKF